MLGISVGDLVVGRFVGFIDEVGAKDEVGTKDNVGASVELECVCCLFDL